MRLGSGADSVNEIDVSEDLERIRVILGKMTKDQILFTLRQVGLRPSNKSDLKSAFINAFIEQWERIYQRVQILAQVAQSPPSAEQSASSTEKPSLPLRSLLHQNISHQLSNLLQLLSLKMMMRAVTANGLVACQKTWRMRLRKRTFSTLTKHFQPTPTSKSFVL